MEMIPVWNNEIGLEELRAFQSAVTDRNIMEGPILEEFQNRLSTLLGVPYVLGTASGSAALALALMAIDIQPGDEVIVPNITFVATANAVKLLGAKAVVADVQSERPTLDSENVMGIVSDKTKAVICVDLNGRIASTKNLWDKLKKRNIYLIDDACQAFLSRNQEGYAGTICDIGCFSFGITKTVSTIQGGAVVTRDKRLYERMKLMKHQGVTNVFFSEEYLLPGFNFKLPDAFAAIGLAQLDKMNEKVTHMRKIYDMYQMAFRDLPYIRQIETKSGEFLWMNDILVESRGYFMDRLKEYGIISRPIGAPLSSASHFFAFEGSDSNTNKFAEQILYLPSGPNQKIENVEKAISCIQMMGKIDSSSTRKEARFHG